ncbi:MAG: hypothetical protein EOO77_41525, partial [Oxalobacteraceae bacterium]
NMAAGVPSARPLASTGRSSSVSSLSLNQIAPLTSMGPDPNRMTPVKYRERYSLKADYPMVAPTYSEARRTMAKSIGLGRKPGQTNVARADAKPTPDPRKRKA